VEKLRKHWVFVVGLAVFVWWFFTGDTPVNILANIIGRGRRLGTHTLDDSGTVIESLDDLVAGASSIVGRPVSADAYMLAAVSASEHAKAGAKEKALIQRVMMNDADKQGWSLQFCITVGRGMGEQSGRRCSTVNGPWEDDLALAEANLAGAQPDDSGGATKFVHKTGFKTITDYYAVCRDWYAESKIVPVDVGGVSSLRIFLPESQVNS
jgi:hypothetical protein